MSTGCECSIIEYRPGQWYYVLEHMHAPKNSYDWREYADAYGPFPTADAAHQSLSDNHANPGGYSEDPYDPRHEQDEVLARLVADAAAPTADGGLRHRGDHLITYRRGPFIWFDNR
jgi:hypothetical protein